MLLTISSVTKDQFWFQTDLATPRGKVIEIDTSQRAREQLEKSRSAWKGQRNTSEGWFH